MERILKANHRGYCERVVERYGFSFAGAVYNGNPDDDRSLVNSGCNVHNMEWITEGALEFIEANAQGPFCLYLATTVPHTPTNPLDGDPRLTPAGWLEKAPRVQLLTAPLTQFMTMPTAVGTWKVFP